MRLTGGGGPLYNFVSSPITEPRGEGYGEDLSEKNLNLKTTPSSSLSLGEGLGRGRFLS